MIDDATGDPQSKRIRRDEALAWLGAEMRGLAPDDPHVAELARQLGEHAPLLFGVIDQAGEAAGLAAGEQQSAADVAGLEAERDYVESRVAMLRTRLAELQQDSHGCE
jgi:uncharacterized protein YceH (UPF0502 family)